MTNREAVIWLINVTADIGKAEHRDLWHYEQALSEIKEILESQPERNKGKWEVHDILDYAQRPTGRKVLRCPFCKYLTDDFRSRADYYHELTHFCPNCGAEMEGGQDVRCMRR